MSSITVSYAVADTLFEPKDRQALMQAARVHKDLAAQMDTAIRLFKAGPGPRNSRASAALGSPPAPRGDGQRLAWQSATQGSWCQSKSKGEKKDALERVSIRLDDHRLQHRL